MDTLQVNPSSVQASILSFLRYFVVIISGVSAILGLASTHDLRGMILFFQGEGGLAFIAAVIAVCTAAYGVWNAYRRNHFLVIAAHNPRVPEITIACPDAGKVDPAGGGTLKTIILLGFLLIAAPAVMSLTACDMGGGSAAVNSASTIATKGEIGINDLYVAASKAGEKLIGVAWTKEQFKAADRKAYEICVKYSAGQATLAQFNAALAALTTGAFH